MSSLIKDMSVYKALPLFSDVHFNEYELLCKILAIHIHVTLLDVQY